LQGKLRKRKGKEPLGDTNVFHFFQSLFQSSSPQNNKTGSRKVLAVLAIILESTQRREKVSKDTNRSSSRSVFKKRKKQGCRDL